VAFDEVQVQGRFFVGVGRGRRGRGAAGSVGGDHGLKPDLLNLLQPALLPQIGVRGLASQKGARSRRPEGASRVLPDDAGSFGGQGVGHGVHVLLGDEDHQLP
jgi:hypothetical protein